ncbi:MAG: hypothetical protein IPG48_16060 [Saprospiraceae bacterium]|nr:hypothetical protein [Saprospiraceae bacterium]MBK6667610.1 hypothetical protein [Saprospiraceae bacterium]MBP6539391.1 hypothetical protein [Saprospiraceae bacterium]
MKNKILIHVIFGLISFTSCEHGKSQQMTDVEMWQLGWRMIGSSMDENFELANIQFDTILKNSKTIDSKYLITGLEVKKEIGKDEEIIEILSSQPIEMLQEICKKQVLSNFEICKKYSVEIVENEKLQLELIKMYVNDQYVRSNLMTDILQKYNLSKDQVIIDSNGINTDERNRERLKEIIDKYGFPTKKMVGKDAMNGVFFMIQHADGENAWQKSQLTNIKNAVKMGDLDSQSYAYLYDRIKINSGEKQLYGTQFANVDAVNNIVELDKTEDIDNLDKRRMEIGMMPIEMYKKLMLKNIRK